MRHSAGRSLWSASARAVAPAALSSCCPSAAAVCGDVGLCACLSRHRAPSVSGCDWRGASEGGSGIWSSWPWRRSGPAKPTLARSEVKTFCQCRQFVRAAYFILTGGGLTGSLGVTSRTDCADSDDILLHAAGTEGIHCGNSISNEQYRIQVGILLRDDHSLYTCSRMRENQPVMLGGSVKAMMLARNTTRLFSACPSFRSQGSA